MIVDKKKVLYVINPLSGGNDKTPFVDSLQNFSMENNMEYKVFYTTGNNDFILLKEQILDFNPEIIIAVGGDGTCNLVGSTIVNTNKVMALVPFGSANGMASELNIPVNVSQALHILIHGRVKIIDTITINKRLCIHLSDIGLNAKVIKRFEEEKVRGIYGYAKQFFKELWYYKPSRYVFLYNNLKFKKRAHVVAIANATRYGTGAVINPNGKIDDGKFEVCIVKPYPFWGIFTITAAIFLGYLDKIKYADIRSFTKITIINKSNQPLHIDGEIIELASVIEAEINPLSLKIIVPL
ncbi:MAG: diacylglycerol kinase family lipid kinase [Bacteroidetes bacterium]|nr:diacylglycerol kinase family lipid kinase [Bacteroidota bacterium]HET6243962.1 diacylglycerol kinase family protein [Bacteroidia bacterium]